LYLLDTCVISELAPGRSQPQRDLADWLGRNGRDCYISAVTLTELAYGVAWLRHRGATAKAARLVAWQEEMVRFHAGRIIPIDIDIAVRAGALLSIARAAGFDPDTEDAWIAATAELHGMEVLTFNEADFRPMRVASRDPLTDLPPDRAP
jgi:predicted nucleic acid-binding protein